MGDYDSREWDEDEEMENMIDDPIDYPETGEDDEIDDLSDLYEPEEE